MLVPGAVGTEEQFTFRNTRSECFSFGEVFNEVLEFVKKDPEKAYRISIGTDSLVRSSSVFVSCIIVHRIGKGAIGFLHKEEIPRKIKSLREKIYLETYMSLRVAYMFDEDKLTQLYEALSNSRNRDIILEFHIDIGTKGETKTLINEMVGMVKGINFIPKIKPESYCASSFANRYTKKGIYGRYQKGMNAPVTPV